MSRRKRSLPRFVSALALALLLAPLASPPARAATDEGRPACDYCRMIMNDAPFGGEITTNSGERKIYDSIECLAAAVLTDSVALADIRDITVTDHEGLHGQLPLGRAAFVHCPSLESPMGLSLAACASRVRAERACADPGAHVLDWRGVLTRVNDTWFEGKLSVQAHVGHFPDLPPAPRSRVHRHRRR